MQVSVEKPGTPEEILEHFGTKGMKWGVRRAYVARRQAEASMYRRKAEGRASKTDRYVTLGITKKRSEKRAKKIEAEVRRMKAGKATTKDILRYYGSVSMVDVLRAAGKEPGSYKKK